MSPDLLGGRLTGDVSLRPVLAETFVVVVVLSSSFALESSYGRRCIVAVSLSFSPSIYP